MDEVLPLPYFPVAAVRAFEVGGYPNATIYAHYYFRPFGHVWGRFVKTVPAGRTTGPCGTLSSRIRLFSHVRAREGGWTVVINNHKGHVVHPATGTCVGVVQWPGGRSPFGNDPYPGLYMIEGVC